ncbi:MAG TPA: gephyrin-like molybdotransferase Glp [Solirubrobacteraceae bacterium]
MLSVDEARAAVLAEVRPLAIEKLPLSAALAGRVLAQEVISAAAVPPFDNSAMDGFAVVAGPGGRELRIVGESRAGAPAGVAVGEHEAIRISTGAELPAGATAVVMVERTQERDGTVVVEETTPGQNVRRAGEDVAEGATVLRPGTVLGAAALGVAANAGAAQLQVAKRPRVAVITTGDELQPVGTPLGPGEIHDSNGIALATLARQAGADVVVLDHAADDRERTTTLLGDALGQADVLLVTGGVSVGPHDHVKPALAALGVQERFWRVALRPGKPTWFGTREDKLVFGLPGNPVSSVVTFILFAQPALAALQGAEPLQRRSRAVLTVTVKQTPHRDEMVRVTLEGDRATPTGPQGSHVLTSLLGADGLARVPAGEGELPAGSDIDVLRIGSTTW